MGSLASLTAFLHPQSSGYWLQFSVRVMSLAMMPDMAWGDFQKSLPQGSLGWEHLN